MSQNDTTIAEKLQALQRAHADIASAIANKGGNVSANDGFTSFASLIDNLPQQLVVGKLTQVVDKSVTSITAADLAGATKIGTSSFAECYNLSSLTLPNSITEIGARAFDDCRSLSGEIVIPNSVISIGANAFYNQFPTNTPSFVIGSGVAYIGYEAFLVDGVTSYTILATSPPVLENSNGLKIGVTKYIPNGTLHAYESATNWSAYIGDFVELSA